MKKLVIGSKKFHQNFSGKHQNIVFRVKTEWKNRRILETTEFLFISSHQM